MLFNKVQYADGVGDKNKDFTARQLDYITFEGRYINSMKVYYKNRFIGLIACVRKYDLNYNNVDKLHVYAYKNRQLIKTGTYNSLSEAKHSIERMTYESAC
jgi:hypothetical protein